MTSGLKVLAVGHLSTYGGAQNVLLHHVRAWSAEQIEIHVAFPEEGPICEDLRALGVSVHVVDFRRWIDLNPEVPESCSFSGYLDCLDARVEGFCKLIDKVQPAVVLCNTTVMLEPVLAAQRSGLPWVWWVHELFGRDEMIARSRFAPVVKLVAMLGSGWVLASSRAVTQQFEGVLPEARIACIPNGAPGPTSAEGQRENASDEFRALFVGNLIRRKGVEPLFDAMAEVLQDHDNVRFLVAGREYEYTFAELHARAAGSQHVSFLGFCDDIPRLLADVDVLVVPSRGDPFPTVVLEAMAAGRAVIGTRSGGMEDQIVAGETGLLVDVDDVVGLSKAIATLAEDRKLCNAMGEAGRVRWQQNYTLARSAASISALLERAVGTACEPANQDAAEGIEALLAALSARGREAEWLQAQFERLLGVEEEYRALLNRFPFSLVRRLKRLLSRGSA